MNKNRIAGTAFWALFAAFLLFPVHPAHAVEEVRIVIKDHKFEPSEVRVPAGVKINLIVVNEDPSPEEFESHSLNREKVIQGGKTATIKLPKLKPGKYDFFGEFNPETAQGVIIAE
ncbi:MAG TPA: cupredoxin domain-containing protein [Nitrospiria bacterium]|nr:cupredoxin domain-containing protein [Nitrospiria bacterium]